MSNASLIVSVVAVVFSGIAVVISCVVAYVHIKNRDESRRARDFNTMLRILEEVDNETARKDRQFIYALSRDKSKDWSNIPKIIEAIGNERVQSIERTINKLDNICFFLDKGYSWGEEPPKWIWETIIEIWERLGPFIEYFRTQPGRQSGYAVYFERFTQKAKN